MRYLITNLLTVAVIIFTGANLQAQLSYVLTDSSTMSITGTSTLHDWESQVTEIDVEVQATLDAENPDLQTFSLTFPVKSIKSEKSKMEKKTYRRHDPYHIPFFRTVVAFFEHSLQITNINIFYS